MRTTPALLAHLPRSAPRRLVLLVLCTALCAAAAIGAPLRAPRPAPTPLAPLAPSVSSTALERACATSLDDMAGLLAEATAQRAATGAVAMPTTFSADVDGIAVLEDDGTFFWNDKGGNPNLDIAVAGRAFYRTHGDDYDQVIFYLASGMSHWLGSPTALAAAWPLRNIATGVGLSLYEYNASLGLPPRLQTVLTMNGLHRYPADPIADVPGLPWYSTQDVLAHEFGHQWLSYPLVQSPADEHDLLGRAFQHWSFFFDSEGSVMEGPDWVPQGPDTFSSLPPIMRFGPLDQYLMGVRSAAEVDSFFVIDANASFTPPGPYVSFSDPNPFLTARGASRRYGIQDVIAANGPRTPVAGVSPTTMDVAFVLITPHGVAPTAADLAELAAIRAAFPATVQSYTGGRMAVDIALHSHAGRVVIGHERLPDTETPGVPRVVKANVTVDPAGIPIAVDPAGVSVSWRTSPLAAWNPVPMTPAGADTFTAVLPGQPPGTTVEYWFRAESDSVGLGTALPELATSLPFSYFTGPDVSPPVVTHWAQHAQSNERLPQVLRARASDRLGVQSVWCEVSVNGAPASVLPTTKVGRDTFSVSIGAGQPQGTKIAYRFVARDASAAQNLGYSNPSFDTLRVGHDHVDGVWNPGPWTHANVLFNRRDEWRVMPDDGAPSGSAAWHCGLDSLPYGPYQDAALLSGIVAGIAPGCSLSFLHRYDFEEAGSGFAFDGARLEVSQNGGPWTPLQPAGGYTHVMASDDQGLPKNAPCWSGRQASWARVSADLSPYAPGPVRVRFRMSSDLFVGMGGWWVDDIRFRFADEPTTDVESLAGAIALGPAWPNPALAALHHTLRLSQGARVDWALYDVAGRRVATLWRGTLAAGLHELDGSPSRALAGGLYFSRVNVNGRWLPSQRVALLR